MILAIPTILQAGDPTFETRAAHVLGETPDHRRNAATGPREPGGDVNDVR
jgi:hypothetical protein